MTALHRYRVLLVFATAVLAGIAGGVVASVLGRPGHQIVITRTGVAYASATQAVVETGGWSYRIPLDVPWIDAQGALQDESRPACLPPYRRTSIVFGSVDVAVEGRIDPQRRVGALLTADSTADSFPDHSSGARRDGD